MKLVKITTTDVARVMPIINSAKQHLKEQGINQWQMGYPDEERIIADAKVGKGFFVKEEDVIIAYLYIDLEGDPAYEQLKGQWVVEQPYVVVHRMALCEDKRGQGRSAAIFSLVEAYAKQRNINYFRLDTDEGNKKMQHILKKNGFNYRGILRFDNSEKMGFDKLL